MQSQLESAKSRLFDKKDGLDAGNIKLFPGDNRDTTAEQMAEQINRALTQIEAGEYDEVTLDDND